MRVVVVGCGYVSTFYARTMPNHLQLSLHGATDIRTERTAKFCDAYGVKRYESLDDVLQDPSVDAIINLTNPDDHFEISKAALLANKHVYSEKPLATKLDHAFELVSLAKQRGLQLSSAPCNVLSETAQTMGRALREGVIGQPRLVYAEMDDGMIHRLGFRDWINELGQPWPYRDEFEVGCTLEHAGYCLTWLVAFFGSVESMTTFPASLIDDKVPQEHWSTQTPDFSVACLKFASGVVARLTCSIVAPHDHRLRVFGDSGELSVEDTWYYEQPVLHEPFSTLSMRMRKIPGLARWRGVHPRRLPLMRGKRTKHRYRTGGHQMDFSRGVAEMADAIAEQRESRLSADFSLHINEVVLKIQNPPADQSMLTMQTQVPPMPPMPWAETNAPRSSSNKQEPVVASGRSPQSGDQVSAEEGFSLWQPTS